MAINIDYGPIGLGLSLAAKAGEGDYRRNRLDAAQKILATTLQRQQVEADIAYRDKAFELQKAQAERMARRDTPAASHIIDQATIVRQDRAAKQTAIKVQLDSMLQSGQITNEGYQKAMLGAISGDDTMLTQALAADKPNISNTQEVSIIRGRHTAQRRTMERDLAALEKARDAQSWLPEYAVKAEATYGPKIDAMRKRVDDSYQAEEDEISGIRTKGGAPTTGAGGGTMSIVPELPPGNTIGQQDPGSIVDDLAPRPAPPVSQRVIGKTYQLPNGKLGIWRGNGWEVQ